MSENKNQIRTFGLTTLSVMNRTTVFFITAIIVLFGIKAYQDMPKESFPEIKLPTIVITAPYPGNSPENIEKLIVVPIEKELKSISGVSKVNASALENYASIIVEFETDVEVEIALRDVKDAVDKAKNELPTDLDKDPQVSEINLGETPVMNLNLYGNFSMDQLKDFAEDLKDKVEDLDEIKRVEIKGVEDKEVKIDIDMYKLSSLQLSFNDVAQAIAGRNLSMSAGTFKANGLMTSLKIDGEFRSVNELNDIVIKHEKGEEVYLKNVLANPIVLESEEKNSYARFQGQNVVMLSVIKGSGKNLIEASDKIMSILNARDKSSYIGILPSSEDLNITITQDQSDQVKTQVNDLLNNIISGVVLVVLILLFFLGTRNALFVGLAIPLSMFMSFMILSVMGVTINMMVLFGLIMALGMLVDNGIVVVENVYRLMSEGKKPIDAAIEGVGEIAWPIISSTATTLAAFLPLAIWPGIMGEFMKFLPLTLIVVLGSSLFVALVVNPAFVAIFMRVEVAKTKMKRFLYLVGALIVFGFLFLLGSSTFSTVMSNLFLWTAFLLILNEFVLSPAADRFQANFLPKMENAYERFLQYAMDKKKPIAFFAGTWMLLVLSFVLVGVAQPKVLFFPDNEPKLVNVFIELPMGAEIEESNNVALLIEKQIKAILDTTKAVDADNDSLVLNDAVKAVFANAGKGTSDPSDPFSGGDQATPHKARVTVEFKDYALRNGINTTQIQKALTDLIDTREFPNAVIVVAKDAAGPPAGKPVNIEITGEDFQVLIGEAAKVQNAIKHSNVSGVEQIKNDLEQGKPEYVVDIDNAKAEKLGLSTQQIAMTLRTALYGREVSKYKDGDDDYPIQLRVKEEDRNNINSLMNQMITFRSQSSGQIVQVPINAVASIKPAYSFGSIRRKNYKKVITVYSNVEPGYNATDVNNELKDALVDLEMKDGYTFKFTGEQESQEKEMAFLTMALLIALFLILLIIVMQFNRISTPIIIMSSVVLSTIGVFLGLVIFKMDFVIIMTMIGIISLAGIVVNNAIVLLDYSIFLSDNKKAELGMGEGERLSRKDLVDILVQAGKTRLRPVLLTAITTVLGLVPLAIGLNIDFFGLITNYNPNIYVGGENVIFWGPMSWTIIYGVTFATFLTLVIVPVMYLGAERLKYYIYTTREQRVELDAKNQA